MKYMFSPSGSTFYIKEMQSQYEAAGSWPQDPVEIDDDFAERFMGQPPEGKTRGSGPDGMPAWVDAPSPGHEERLARAGERKKSLLSMASQKIVVWQTKLMIGRKLNESETASLNAWLDYVDNVEAVDISAVSTTAPVVWPEVPA